MRLSGLAVAGVLATAAAAQAAVDNLINVLPSSLTVGGVTTPAVLGAYGYDAATGSYYAIGFNAAGQDLRHISGGTITRLITNSPLNEFTRGGSLNNGGGVATPSGLLLNPKPILNPDGSVAIPAYGTAVIADAAGVVSVGGTARRDLSRRIYRADVYKFANGSVAPNVATSNQVLVPLVTTADLATLTGYAGTSNSANTGRQVAYSGDGQSVYFVDTSDAYGGLYKTAVLTGATVRISADTADNNTEPAVRTVNGVDQVFIRGGGSTGNLNGLDVIDTSTGVRSVAVAASRLSGLLENTLTNIASATSDADGNIYFSNTNSTAGAGGGIYRLDKQNRVIKVLSYSERRAVNTGNFNAGQFRMQVNGATAYAGANGSFNVPLLTYAELSPQSAVNGVLLFQPVDLNRDNAVNVADLQLLGSKLTLRGVKQTNSDLFRFDLNGNDAVDYGDVKVAQQFLNFSNGDANLDLSLDYADLDVLRDNYNGSADKTWVLGDLTGNNVTDFGDLVQLASSWLDLTARPTAGDLQSRYSGFYLSEVERAFDTAAVPEPAAVATLALAATALLRRRRNG